jgi:PAS domain S-box-containing protein
MQQVIADIEDSAKNLSKFTCEFRVKIPGKPVQWIFSRSTPELLPDGGVTWFGFNADITYRKQIEEALSESENKFRKIYEEGPFGIALANGESKFVMANEAFCKITGYNERELKNLSFKEITHPDDRETGMTGFTQLVQRQIPVYKAEKRYIRKDGKVIWGSVTVTPIYDDKGQFSYNLAMVEDISERKKAVDDVIFLNNKLVILIDAIQELATSTCMDDIVKTVHTSARQLVNADGSSFIVRDGDLCYYIEEDAIGPLFKGKRFPMEECISGWAMIHKQAVVIEDIYADERVPTDAYRSTFVKSLAIAPIRKHDPLGAIGAYWAAPYLVSETEMQLLQTLADAAAKAVENIQLIEGLEKTVSDRTAELQLLNKEMEAFSYSVSHDLRAPLRHINGFSEILVRQYAAALPGEAKKIL